MKLLRSFARYGRFALIAGLLAGVLLPGPAALIKAWLPPLIVLLLFLTAFRIGHRDALSGLASLGSTLKVVLIFQLAMPLAALAVVHLLGLSQSVAAVAVVLVLAAPALSGSPNLSILVGANPEPAFRLLVLGIALLPLTMFPVFWLVPQLGDIGAAVSGAIRTLIAIGIAVCLGFVCAAKMVPERSKEQTQATDGAMTIALFVIVIGLMAPLRPALEIAPFEVLAWLALAFALNLGMQAIAFGVLRTRGEPMEIVPFSIVAGNRNVAIFLIALSPEVAEQLLIFIGCYQIPMYLTPILTRRFYATA